ncbi:methionyl tRNA synthetase [Auricularia subglabra TFB-10046 SS5]|nr:methionyl tRNA synthetase [Auricularia subglabra TFB-10046 SS5]
MSTQKIRDAPGLLRAIPKPGEKTLPVDGEENILITSALPYCNNVPHLGNLIGSLLSADVFSRYNRTRNRRTLYVCGTDEYGTATETQALKEGVTPRELCDKYNALHRETYDWFQLEFDLFGRTSTPLHTEICQEIFNNLYKNGNLVKKTQDQTYCETEGRFLADRFVEGTCPHCGAKDARGDQCDSCSRTLDALDLIEPRCLLDVSHKVIKKPSSHMYIALDKIQPETEAWMKEAALKGKWGPNSVINHEGHIVDPRLLGGLKPSPITRDLKWGVPAPVPEGETDVDNKVLYVWFDACIGYVSITANYTPEWRQWWFNQKNVKLYQFMGKDNTYFHSVLFPSSQLGDGRDWTMLHHLSTTEFLNYENGKFSKRYNRGVFGPAARETGVPPDVWRYYLLSIRPETSDSMFSWADFGAANNNVLLKNFGNFVNRALKFTAAKYDSIVPDGGDAPGPFPTDASDPDAEFIKDVNDLIAQYRDSLDNVKLRGGLQHILSLSGRGNLYLQQAGLSNALLDSDPKRCAQVVARALNLIYVLAVLIEPYMPNTAASINTQLDAPKRTVPDAFALDILPGHKIGAPALLFHPIDDASLEAWRQRFGGSGQPSAAGGATSEDRKKPAAKKGGAKKAAAVQHTGPKSAEALALEEKVAAQGNVVRGLKEKQKAGEGVDEELAAALKTLLSLKDELNAELSKPVAA